MSAGFGGAVALVAPDSGLDPAVPKRRCLMADEQPKPTPEAQPEKPAGRPQEPLPAAVQMALQKPGPVTYERRERFDRLYAAILAFNLSDDSISLARALEWAHQLAEAALVFAEHREASRGLPAVPEGRRGA